MSQRSLFSAVSLFIVMFLAVGSGDSDKESKDKKAATSERATKRDAACSCLKSCPGSARNGNTRARADCQQACMRTHGEKLVKDLLLRCK